MTAKKKCLLIFASLLIVAIILWYQLGQIMLQNHRELIRYFAVKDMLKCYIEDTKGKFPNNIESLIEKGYIKVADKKGMYQIRGWTLVPRRDIDRIRFGTRLDKLCIRDDTLVDSSTGQHILLVQLELGGQISETASMEVSKE